MRRFAVLLACAPFVASADPSPRPRARRSPGAALHARGADHADSLSEIAASYGRVGKWDEAVALLDEARATRPDDPDVLGDLIAACMHSPRCAPRRLRLLHEGLEKVPRAGELLDSLAQELVRMGKPQQAVKEIKEFIARHPEDQDARAALIDSAADLGQRSLALAELPAYLNRRPNDVEKLALYVTLLRESHQGAAADKQLDRLLRGSPESVSANLLAADRSLDSGDLRAATRVLDGLRGIVARRRADADGACLADAECVAALDEDARRVDELDKEIKKARLEQHRDLRVDTGFLDLADDLEREADRER